MKQFNFNKEKFKELIIYIASYFDNENINKIKLNKILFFIDFESYKVFGNPICESTYQKFNDNPIAKEFDKVFHEMINLKEVFESVNKNIYSLRKPNLNIFSAEEIAFVNFCIIEKDNLDINIDLVNFGEEIPYQLSLLSKCSDLTLEHYEHIKKVIEKQNEIIKTENILKYFAE